MARHINIVQGECQVSSNAEVVITTLLGSCVAACMYDPVARVGGMNHFLLPGDAEGVTLNARYGVHLMELLVNGLLKKGAARERLQSKLFGGARTIMSLTDIGGCNARFARSYLEREGIAYCGGSLGGQAGRRIQFWPVTGRVRQSLMSQIEEVPPAAVYKPAAGSGELELF